MGKSFVKLIRGRTVEDMLEHDPPAYHLVTVIALRANRTNKINILGLNPGEALIGDYRRYGMTRQVYRGALRRLKKRGFVTTRATSKGTIAKLVDTRIYDINVEDEQPSEQPTSNHPATTNKNKEGKKGKKKTYTSDSIEYRLAQLLLELIIQRKPDYKRPNLQKWTEHTDRMIRIDGRTPENVEQVIRWCQNDTGNGDGWCGWQNVILSTANLRAKFDKLELAMKGRNGDGTRKTRTDSREPCAEHYR
jgi:hypothetical protein